jgi:multidrug efflux pump subunit AcrA (membrane-fusion protein)
MSSTKPDLTQLAVDRQRTVSLGCAPPRRLFSRYVLPVMILGGFVGLLAWASSAQWRTRRDVTVVPVVVSRAAVQPVGTPLFQAPGWIEPRPAPYLVTAIAEGVIKELLVVEGQAVEAGQPVALLVDADAKLAVQRAEAEVERREALAATAVAERDFAEQRLKSPVHLDALLADAEAALADVETRLGQLPSQIEAAEARRKFAEQDLEGKKAASNVLATRIVQRATADRDAAAADLRELQERGPLLERQAAALRRRCAALSTQRELLLDETRKLADAEAQARLSEADSALARTDLAVAQLRLERMTVRAPIAGRVLHLLARPGTRLMGLAMHAQQDSSTVVSLYRPEALQLRVDVRLEDVDELSTGQPVRIETPAAGEPLDGEVLALTSLANIQKNTLEVKVAIKNPPPLLRPEMLATATFLAPAGANDSDSAESTERILVPRQLVEGNGDSATVWIVDAEDRARKRSARLGRGGTAELVEVASGVAPTDRLISSGRENLVEGTLVRISHEDASIGMSHSPGATERNTNRGQPNGTR